MMKLKDIKIEEIGLVKGRDAIQVVGIESNNPRKIKIIGNINSDTCSNKIVPQKYFDIEFLFDRVIMLNIYEDEICGLNISDEEFNMYADSDSESSIEEIENSNIVKMNEEKLGLKNLRHLIITTYDYKVEVVCENFKTLIR